MDSNEPAEAGAEDDSNCEDAPSAKSYRGQPWSPDAGPSGHAEALKAWNTQNKAKKEAKRQGQPDPRYKQPVKGMYIRTSTIVTLNGTKALRRLTQPFLPVPLEVQILTETLQRTQLSTEAMSVRYRITKAIEALRAILPVAIREVSSVKQRARVQVRWTLKNANLNP